MISTRQLAHASSATKLVMAVTVCRAPWARRPPDLRTKDYPKGNSTSKCFRRVPYLVSGGSALLEVDVPNQVALSEVHVFCQWSRCPPAGFHSKHRQTAR